MELELIYNGKATLEDLYQLAGLGFVFEINDGEIKGVTRE